MASKYPTLDSKGLKFVWYGPIPGEENSGGLGMRFTRAKKTRTFFALLTPDQVKDLWYFLGEQLGEFVGSKGVRVG